MFSIFRQDFQLNQGKLPAGWLVEYNSDLLASGLQVDSDSFSLLSPGNKYIAVTPDLRDAELQLTFGCNYAMSQQFELLICCRYDLATRHGEALRIKKEAEQSDVSIEYGRMADNQFEAQQEQRSHADVAQLSQPMPVQLKLNGNELQVEFLDQQWIFKTAKPRAGKFALSRGHFFDVLKISAFELNVQELPKPQNCQEFTVSLPTEPTFYPIIAQLQLLDFGDCCEAQITLSGGVPETPAGEGNYHGMRADLLTRPYFKVLSATEQKKFTLFDGQLVLVAKELAPAYFYEVLHAKVDWPFSRHVRFMKPKREYNLAVGVDEYQHTTAKTQAQNPSETIFSPEGEVLYAGLGLSEVAHKVEFRSQPNKEMIQQLPKSDPRYQQACEFARNNHYFLENEGIHFCVRISSVKELPADFVITLENAYLEMLCPVTFQLKLSQQKIGVLPVAIAECNCEVLGSLAPGVYHLRCQSQDASVSGLEEYCAFEVMSREAGALPPPLLSGLPYLYCGRTETRGLITDAFDPWHGSSVDEGHYMACTNFLPKCARDNQIAPTVHAYQRQWFLWLGTRCADKPLIADNQDLLAQADFANVRDELGIVSLLWLYQYQGELLDIVLDFMRQTGDPRFDLERIAADRQQGEALDLESFSLLARDHWPQWLDFANERIYRKRQHCLQQLRQLNPNIKFANYGPAHIYAGHYKGSEFVRYLLNAHLTPDEQGFWQYEDYPMACRYGIERGTYFLTAALMACPGHRIYPEIYTFGIQGCPDGAVFYAHPPFGLRTSNHPLRIRRRIFDYAFASAHYRPGQGFCYWQHYGFQACGFDRERYEVLLKAWRTVRDFPPKCPLRSNAFVSSEAAWQANRSTTVLRSMHEGSIVDVRKTAAEVVPFAYEMNRRHSLTAGFQIEMETLPELSSSHCDLLVLPPLTGASAASLQAIRRLHQDGVNLLAFEDVSGLEDLFGVKDTGIKTAVRHLRGTAAFLPEQKEFCDEALCTGRYIAAGAEVLLEAEIPVLLQKKNSTATAAFFNIPPTLVRDDQLHSRLGYGNESISTLINEAIALISKKLSNPELSCSAGRLIAFQAQNDAIVIIVTNPHEEQEINPLVEFHKRGKTQKMLHCDRPWKILSETETVFRLRLRLAPEDSAVLVLR